jgi:hypothetical protein
VSQNIIRKLERETEKRRRGEEEDVEAVGFSA